MLLLSVPRSSPSSIQWITRPQAGHRGASKFKDSGIFSPIKWSSKTAQSFLLWIRTIIICLNRPISSCFLLTNRREMHPNSFSLYRLSLSDSAQTFLNKIIWCLLQPKNFLPSTGRRKFIYLSVAIFRVLDLHKTKEVSGQIIIGRLCPQVDRLQTVMWKRLSPLAAWQKYGSRTIPVTRLVNQWRTPVLFLEKCLVRIRIWVEAFKTWQASLA